jgi:hypothetical protein
MDKTDFPIKKTKFLDLIICPVLFVFSYYISMYYPSALLGTLILLSFGFVVQTTFIKPHRLSITEHVLVSAGIGLLAVNILMAGLIHFHKAQWFKEALLLLFLLATVTSFIKRKTYEFKGYHFKKEDVYLWTFILLFFLVSLSVRHADFRFPDEYMYLSKFEDIITDEGYISEFAQRRYFFHYSYSSILEFAKLTFRSTETISLFFVSLSLIPTYLLGKELFNKRTGIIAVLFLAFNPSIVFYSIRLLPWAPSIFLITSYMYFFYKWFQGRNISDFLISGVFITTSIFVKLHGVVFLAIALLYLLLASDTKDLQKNNRYPLMIGGVLSLLSITWNLHGKLWRLVASIAQDIRDDIMGVGYKMYITYFSPDLYAMPFVFLFFFGIAAILKKPKEEKLFLLLPLIVYVLLLSSSNPNFGRGIRNFFVVLPLMSIVGAYGITHRENISRRVFWILLYLYLIILAVMAIHAPRFPHLDHVLPDLPLWIRIITFSLAFVVIFLMIYDWKKEQWQKVEYSIISLVIISSLLNANFFINMQGGYSDKSKNGIVEAGKWLSENTPPTARIQSSTWELGGWERFNIRSNPEMRYPKSTFLSYYVNRTTYAPPRKEDLLLERIKRKEVDYIVIFTDPLLTTSEKTRNVYKYLQKYVDEAPPGTELVYTGYNENQEVLFRIYKVV